MWSARRRSRVIGSASAQAHAGAVAAGDELDASIFKRSLNFLDVGTPTGGMPLPASQRATVLAAMAGRFRDFLSQSCRLQQPFMFSIR